MLISEILRAIKRKWTDEETKSTATRNSLDVYSKWAALVAFLAQVMESTTLSTRISSNKHEKH
jgi:hypothetical protein